MEVTTVGIIVFIIAIAMAWALTTYIFSTVYYDKGYKEGSILNQGSWESARQRAIIAERKLAKIGKILEAAE